MTINIYQTPESEVAHQDSKLAAEFYIVSPHKFIVLFVVTMGLYSVYWFYKNWQRYLLHSGEAGWPVMRAIFSIFFTHSLFENINYRLQDEKRSFNWSPGILATIYVIAAITERIGDKLDDKDIGSPYTLIISFLAIPVIALVLYRAQLAINLACNDSAGHSNSNFTGLNILWIVLGSSLWALMGFVIFAAANDTFF
jgi:hypothetical protein